MSVTGATINAAGGFVADVASSSGIMTVGAGGNVNFNAVDPGTSGRFGINYGTGTLSVVNGVPIAQAGWYGRYLGHITADFDEGKLLRESIVGKLIPLR